MKKLLRLLLATALVFTLSLPALAREEPPAKYPSFDEYLDFYRASADPETKALSVWLDAWIAAHPQEYAVFDADAYFAANIYQDNGVNKENWFSWQLPGYNENHFKAEMLNHRLTDLFRADRDRDNGLAVTVDGVPIQFQLTRDAQSNAVAPRVQDGRILAPVRAITDALGATVEHDAAAQSVTCRRDKIVVVFMLGKADYTVDYDGKPEARTLDVPACAEYGRTYVPLRALAEALGYTVTWNGPLQTAQLTTSTEKD